MIVTNGAVVSGKAYGVSAASTGGKATAQQGAVKVSSSTAGTAAAAYIEGVEAAGGSSSATGNKAVIENSAITDSAYGTTITAASSGTDSCSQLSITNSTVAEWAAGSKVSVSNGTAAVENASLTLANTSAKTAAAAYAEGTNSVAVSGSSLDISADKDGISIATVYGAYAEAASGSAAVSSSGEDEAASRKGHVSGVTVTDFVGGYAKTGSGTAEISGGNKFTLEDGIYVTATGGKAEVTAGVDADKASVAGSKITVKNAESKQTNGGVAKVEGTGTAVASGNEATLDAVHYVYRYTDEIGTVREEEQGASLAAGTAQVSQGKAEASSNTAVAGDGEYKEIIGGKAIIAVGGTEDQAEASKNTVRREVTAPSVSYPHNVGAAYYGGWVTVDPQNDPEDDPEDDPQEGKTTDKVADINANENKVIITGSETSATVKNGDVYVGLAEISTTTGQGNKASAVSNRLTLTNSSFNDIFIGKTVIQGDGTAISSNNGWTVVKDEEGYYKDFECDTLKNVTASSFTGGFAQTAAGKAEASSNIVNFSNGHYGEIYLGKAVVEGEGEAAANHNGWVELKNDDGSYRWFGYTTLENVTADTFVGGSAQVGAGKAEASDIDVNFEGGTYGTIYLGKAVVEGKGEAKVDPCTDEHHGGGDTRDMKNVTADTFVGSSAQVGTGKAEAKGVFLLDGGSYKTVVGAYAAASDADTKENRVEVYTGSMVVSGAELGSDPETDSYSYRGVWGGVADSQGSGTANAISRVSVYNCTINGSIYAIGAGRAAIGGDGYSEGSYGNASAVGQVTVDGITLADGITTGKIGTIFGGSAYVRSGSEDPDVTTSAIAAGNTVVVKNVGDNIFIDTVYGGQANSGGDAKQTVDNTDASHNSLLISGGTYKQIYGGIASGGRQAEASYNGGENERADLSDAGLLSNVTAETFIGGYAVAGGNNIASNNKFTFENSEFGTVIGGKAEGGTATANSNIMTMTGGRITSEFTAAKAIGSIAHAEGNEATLDGVDYEGKEFIAATAQGYTAAAIKNTLTAKGSGSYATLVGGKAIGLSNVGGGSSLTASSNTVDFTDTASKLKEGASVYGGWASAEDDFVVQRGEASSNAVHVTRSDAVKAGNVYGGYVKESGIFSDTTTTGLQAYCQESVNVYLSPTVNLSPSLPPAGGREGERWARFCFTDLVRQSKSKQHLRENTLT